MLNWYNTDDGIETGLLVMLVDGYNVCGYWANLKKHFMKGKLEIARDKFIHELVTFNAFKGLCFASLHTFMMNNK